MNNDIEQFDPRRAWTLRDAIASGKLNYRGRRPSLQLVQRWANPKRGCRPTGAAGPLLVLLAVRTGRELLTMPEWVEWFVRARQSALVERARRIVVADRGGDARRAEAARERLRAEGVRC